MEKEGGFKEEERKEESSGREEGREDGWRGRMRRREDGGKEERNHTSTNEEGTWPQSPADVMNGGNIFES